MKDEFFSALKNLILTVIYFLISGFILAVIIKFFWDYSPLESLYRDIGYWESFCLYMLCRILFVTLHKD